MSESRNGGAYRLIIRLPEPTSLRIGRLGYFDLPAGTYAYLGSARRGLRQRVERHCRLATKKQGPRHWHIDALLLHPASQLVRTDTFAGAEECMLARRMAKNPGADVPVPGFGATDCRENCPAHLFRVKP